ncbi:hypothetical protein TIFTF001_016266 [Ficus carica]|uniref:Uncharacterized protein n=1 Tax=Ficus carica TaxID=3494 RepID=A0AA88A7A0_FICCA|nr:hypothetical protein TIFTF001_016266 [Ficus carica]
MGGRAKSETCGGGDTIHANNVTKPDTKTENNNPRFFKFDGNRDPLLSKAITLEGEPDLKLGGGGANQVGKLVEGGTRSETLWRGNQIRKLMGQGREGGRTRLEIRESQREEWACCWHQGGRGLFVDVRVAPPTTVGLF